MRKSLGQLAYESELASVPLHEDGTHRPAWSQLDHVAQWSWERSPSPRWRGLEPLSRHGLYWSARPLSHRNTAAIGAMLQALEANQ